MPRLIRCSVRGCNTTNEQSAIKLFCFPSFLDQCEAWIKFCDNPIVENRYSTGFKKLSRERICAIHFPENNFHSFKKDKIFRGVIPSLYPPLSVIKTEPSSPCQSPTPFLSSVQYNCSHNHLLEVNESSQCSGNYFLPSSVNQSPDVHHSVPETSLMPDELEDLHVPDVESDVSNECTNRTKDLQCSDTRLTGLAPFKRDFLGFGRTRKEQLNRVRNSYRMVKNCLRSIKSIFVEDEDCVINVMKSYLNPYEATLLVSKLRHFKRKPRVQRWSLGEKLKALSIYRKSPEHYRLLCYMFVLPPEKHLFSHVNSIHFTAGINHQLFSSMSNSLCYMQDCDRVCVLTFSEVAIREFLEYSPSTDSIIGFEDHGHLGRTGTPARYALTFMVCGLIKKWKQPIAVYFSSNRTKSKVLVSLIDVVLQKCNEAGLRVFAVICDMSPGSVKAIKSMGSSVLEPYILHQGRLVVTLFNPPCLLKATRDLLFSGDILIPMDTVSLNSKHRASWEHIRILYENDMEGFGLRGLHKLTGAHISPSGKYKTKVKYAAQVFSHSVAARMLFDVANNLIPSAAVGTATFLKTMDSLFDSLNGEEGIVVVDKPLRSCVTKNSRHVKFWKESLKSMRSWKYLKETEQENLENKSSLLKQPLCHKAWMLTLRGVQMLWDLVSLEEKFGLSINCLSTCRLNQDPLEKLFASIRAEYDSNADPTAMQFINSLKTYIFNGPIGKKTMLGDYIEDDAQLLSRMHLHLEDSFEETKRNETSNQAVQGVAVGYVSEVGLSKFDSGVLPASLCNFVVRKVMLKIKCDGCRAGLCRSSSDASFNSGIFSIRQRYNKQDLVYPSEKMVKFVNPLITSIENMLNDRGNESEICRTIFETIQKKFSMAWLIEFCSVHVNEVRDLILDHAVCCVISKWCKDKNMQKLSGKK